MHAKQVEDQKTALLVGFPSVMQVCSNGLDIFGMLVFPLDIGIFPIFGKSTLTGFDTQNIELYRRGSASSHNVEESFSQQLLSLFVS